MCVDSSHGVKISHFLKWRWIWWGQTRICWLQWFAWTIDKLKKVTLRVVGGERVSELWHLNRLGQWFVSYGRCYISRFKWWICETVASCPWSWSGIHAVQPECWLTVWHGWGLNARQVGLDSRKCLFFRRSILPVESKVYWWLYVRRPWILLAWAPLSEGRRYLQPSIAWWPYIVILKDLDFWFLLWQNLLDWSRL